MIGLKFISMAKPRKILASSSRPTDPSPSLPSPSPSSNNLNPPLLKSQPRLELQKKKKQNQRQLSVAEIERAIGAGIFRDRDTSREAKESKTSFDSILSNSEGDVERKLRETDEWLIDKTEDISASAGKKILVVVFKWILPLWILAFLVASGMVNLPFSTPFLDDLLL
ncbi:putative NAD(P)H dehydrogenase subunit CRR3, chloroplastic isoform X2 [Nicotiana tabacum]|uniref:NAD(P)H dehydrogenase subunit CRR3, chloroplastic isoform X2 n=1 Tax=Nicotiana tabacum TaxID=4097 RepID=A0A1S3ZSR6_TOBAC|nr:probable NAD(P)H dehydrogenase subunit CRR3, chloroplastic [Nicotiana tomentosiformis]XP_016467348.1 PREDICTED: probable NAD(P)H dehydrogenase subunit CRR3, chloroplastic [Nicotiana tabacum]